jgi:hypothetical protein
MRGVLTATTMRQLRQNRHHDETCVATQEPAATISPRMSHSPPKHRRTLPSKHDGEAEESGENTIEEETCLEEAHHRTAMEDG